VNHDHLVEDHHDREDNLGGHGVVEKVTVEGQDEKIGPKDAANHNGAPDTLHELGEGEHQEIEAILVLVDIHVAGDRLESDSQGFPEDQYQPDQVNRVDEVQNPLTAHSSHEQGVGGRQGVRVQSEVVRHNQEDQRHSHQDQKEAQQDPPPHPLIQKPLGHGVKRHLELRERLGHETAKTKVTQVDPPKTNKQRTQKVLTLIGS